MNERPVLPRETVSPAAVPPRVAVSGVRVTYGPTVAVDDLSITVGAGEVIGLVGANGAGKSTLMRVLAGAATPDAGTVAIDGTPVNFAAFGPGAAHGMGVRIVWQELSLCANLTVAENMFVERPLAGRSPLFWRAPYARIARESLDAVFPDAGIAVGRAVEDLPIGQRQMVEIARAATAPGLRLLILDEPTSSLDAVRSGQLRAFVQARAREGLSVIFISHKLGEVLDVATRVFVMRNGRAVLDAPAESVNASQLVDAMGGGAEARNARTSAATTGKVLARLDRPLTARLGHALALHAGEIVGVAGLEGDGQKTLLEALFAGSGNGATRAGKAAYVSGDRAREGVFALWPVSQNIAIGRIARRSGWSLVSAARERAAVEPEARRLDLDPARFASNILELSGGNQQKALAARALGTDAEILILEDPTRGVDIGTKRLFYKVAREAAESGKLVVWHSTEDAEFAECDRVLVMASGSVAAILSGDDLSEERVLATAFAAREGGTCAADGPGLALRAARAVLRNAAIVGLVAVCGALASLNPMVASTFGIELLMGPAVALTLIALAQMFVVGGSEIDLGVGAFAGLVNVLSATLLVSAPLLGGAAILAGLAGYALMAAIVRLRAVPAIVVTLGASFIWYGVGYSVQPAPGGAAPDWLRATTQWSIPGIPTPLVLVVAATVVALILHRSRMGTVLRGFGASPMALERSGWSPLTWSIVRYVVAGAFAGAGGLAITAMNGASDINAGSGYTLLAVAAVVLGGCRLLGGVISPVGVAAGAVTLSLIGALLGALGVSTDFNAAVQGLLMILVLGLRALVERSR
ncbi:ATP-binding cassette domain-containing protein [Acuticoccus sp. MNP-M23]|uniref:ATP-binding cassette domain-containing protein n=1 Tax=Acuticoccus sp. MNP-M23 TaxID=3072793 RepID=UPI0028161ED8|nr:ATP-binding cassette domain-containing protein [Acuticoccus sp. MNP-M23]WMS41982.1 ATP-binding cassette domain-containing protein [Acuticoccus sp. MNP-M23]